MTPVPQTSVLLITAGGWHFPQTALAFERRGALAGLWISNKNSVGLPEERFRRCWPFHALLKPFFHFAPQIWTERAFYSFFPVWRAWLRGQTAPECQVVQAIMGFATEAFDLADKRGALKVIDCQNSHPTSYFGYWQRECDLWCPGEKVPIPRWMFARMTREIERADLVLCPSDFVRDTMLLNGVPPEKCFVSPFGVDASVFVCRSMPPPVPRFVSVGTICVRKGHQYLFRAFQKVKACLPDAELVCVGDYKADFAEERRKWEGTFRHIPSLTHADLASLLTSCSAFVLASVEEGFARVIAEAMGAGLPVVATYESGAGAQVTEGVEGYIVPARRVDLLAEAMIRATGNPMANAAMGHAARLRAVGGNTWQDYGDRLIMEYARRLQG